MHKCSDEEHLICLNNTKCFLCDGKRLYKRPKWMELKDKQKEKKEKNIRKKEKEGMRFEKKVAKKYNEAKRTINSGALYFCPGDIVTPNELIECKERGSTTARGEKTFTIQKQQLEKIKSEAQLMKKKNWYYIFGFKNDDEIYITKSYDSELEMLQYIEQLEKKISEKDNKK